MNSKQYVLAYVWLTCLFSIAYSLNLNSRLVEDIESFGDHDDSDSEEDDCGWICQEDKHWKLSDGEIAAIVISVVVIFFAIPIGLCFCCAWCCFRGRRRGQRTQIVAVAAPIVPQYHQHPYNNMSNASNPVVGNHNYAYSYTNYHQPSYPLGQQGQNPTESPYPRQLYATIPSLNASGNTSDIYERPPPYYEATLTPVPQSTNTPIPSIS